MKKIELTETLKNVLEEYLDTTSDTEKAEYIKKVLVEAKEENTELTEKATKILNWLKENKDKESYSAKEIGNNIFMSGRAVSGSIRKLVNLGYVKKIGGDPVQYSLDEIAAHI